MDDFEKRWQRIQDMLGSEARGDAPMTISSTRTLFGIPSAVEQKMDSIVREDEEARRAARIRAKREASGEDERAEREE